MCLLCQFDLSVKKCNEDALITELCVLIIELYPLKLIWEKVFVNSGMEYNISITASIFPPFSFWFL